MSILDGWELYHFNIRGPLIAGDHVIGSYFFEGHLTGKVYANFLQNILPQLMEDVPLHVRMNMWMQHDGAPPHYALCSRKVMNEIFYEKWIGRGGPWFNITRLLFMGFCQRPRLVDPLKVIIPNCFDLPTIFILCVTRMTLCCRSMNSS